MTADQLITPSELASWLQSDIDTATANLLIAEATGMVQEVTGQRLVQVLGDTFEIEGSPDQWLELPQRPVTGVASVVFQDGSLAPVTLDPTQYQVVGNRIWRGFGWQYATVLVPPARIPFWRYLTYPPPSTISGVYDHGWPAGHWRLEPARRVCFALCAQAYNNPGGARSMTVDDYTESYSDMLSGMQMPETVRASLHKSYGHSAGSLVPR